MPDHCAEPQQPVNTRATPPAGAPSHYKYKGAGTFAYSVSVHPVLHTFESTRVTCVYSYMYSLHVYLPM